MIIYELYDGRIVDADDMKKAFYLCTGVDPDTNEGRYIRFLNDCFGLSIARYYKPTVKGFIEAGYKIHAIRLYREENKCGLHEAKDAVDKMWKEYYQDELVPLL